MKKLNTLTLNLKNTRSYFQAYKILNIAFNFLDKHLNYNTKTIDGNIEDYTITINLTFTKSSEAYKLENILDLFDELDFLAEEETEEETEN